MWWMRRMGRVRVSRRGVWIGAGVFVFLAVLGHFDPNPGGVARPAVVTAAAAEGGSSRPVLKQAAHHALAHVPHRLPYWARGGYGYGGQQGDQGQAPAGDGAADVMGKLY